MEMFRIAGGTRLAGSIRVEGSKNAALPILAASVAITGNVQLEQVPKLQDVTTMSTLLQGMGVSIAREHDNTIVMNTNEITSTIAPYELVRQMRAGICVLGPLLARFGTATVALPGGCKIGHRPVDLHLQAARENPRIAKCLIRSRSCVTLLRVLSQQRQHRSTAAHFLARAIGYFCRSEPKTSLQVSLCKIAKLPIR